MNETEKWIEQARELLGDVIRNRKHGSLVPLYDHMKNIDLPVALNTLGCGEECSECSWGELGGYPLRGTCRVVAFQETLERMRTNGNDRAGREAKHVAETLVHELDPAVFAHHHGAVHLGGQCRLVAARREVEGLLFSGHGLRSDAEGCFLPCLAR